MIQPDPVILEARTAELARELGGYLGMSAENAIRYCLPDLLYKHGPGRKYGPKAALWDGSGNPYANFLDLCPTGSGLFVENRDFFNAFNAYLRSVHCTETSHRAFTMEMKRRGLSMDGRKDRPPRWEGIGLPVGEVLP